MNKIITVTFILACIFITSFQSVSGESYQEKLEFAFYLEETLGHFWAVEKNLDENNAELALVHATHPISELYVLMKPQLMQNPELDAQIQDTLMQLQHKATTDVSREQAQMALDDAKEIIEKARLVVVGSELSQDTNFQAELVKKLLETSKSEYAEAVSHGVIGAMAEFQDGSAFVLRSQKIFENIKSDVDPGMAQEIDGYYENLWNAYDQQADPSKIRSIVDSMILEINNILGVDDQDKDLLVYVKNIRDLLAQTKEAYDNEENDLALTLATKAYLDNYEYLEGPLTEANQKDLMEQVEVMLREDLRNMIKNNEPSSAVNTQIDEILEKLDNVATVVPEFGTISMMVLALATVSIIVVTTKSKITMRV